MTRSIGMKRNIGGWQQLNQFLLILPSLHFSLISSIVRAPLHWFWIDHVRAIFHLCCLGHLHHMHACSEFAASIPQTAAKNFISAKKELNRIDIVSVGKHLQIFSLLADVLHSSLQFCVLFRDSQNSYTVISKCRTSLTLTFFQHSKADVHNREGSSYLCPITCQFYSDCAWNITLLWSFVDKVSQSNHNAFP